MDDSFVVLGEEASMAPVRRQPHSVSSGLTDWIVAKGFAKSREGAEQLLLIVAVIAFMAALAAPFILGPHRISPPPDLQVYIEAMKQQRH